MKYYFFKSVMSKSRNRLRPLSGQTFTDGTPVDSTYNVSADREIRSQYPIGTIFGSDELISSSGYYTAGRICVIGVKDYKSASHKPSKEMLDAYERFIGVSAEEPMTEDTSTKDEEKSPRSKRSYLEKMQRNKSLQPPTIDNDGFYVNPKNWYLLIRNIQNQINTMMIGATGSGKTELVLLACKKLGIPCHVYDMGSMYDPIAGLLGVHRISKGGESIFDYAKFTKDIQEPGVILLDELSRAPVTTNNILFPCLDSRRKLPVEIAGGDDLRSVDINPECTFIATANVGAEYTGTSSMDKALINRFFPLELEYMPVSQEIDVLRKRSGISRSDSQMIVSVANNVRNLYKKQELSSSLSTRETLMTASLVNDGWKLIDAMELVFLPIFEGTDYEGERSIVRKIFASK